MSRMSGSSSTIRMVTGLVTLYESKTAKFGRFGQG